MLIGVVDRPGDAAKSRIWVGNLGVAAVVDVDIHLMLLKKVEDHTSHVGYLDRGLPQGAENPLRERKLVLVCLVVTIVVGAGGNEGETDATILWIGIPTWRVECQYQMKYRATTVIMANAIDTIVANVDTAEIFDLNDHYGHPLAHPQLRTRYFIIN